MSYLSQSMYVMFHSVSASLYISNCLSFVSLYTKCMPVHSLVFCYVLSVCISAYRLFPVGLSSAFSAYCPQSVGVLSVILPIVCNPPVLRGIKRCCFCSFRYVFSPCLLQVIMTIFSCPLLEHWLMLLTYCLGLGEI